MLVRSRLENLVHLRAISLRASSRSGLVVDEWLLVPVVMFFSSSSSGRCLRRPIVVRMALPTDGAGAPHCEGQVSPISRQSRPKALDIAADSATQTSASHDRRAD